MDAFERLQPSLDNPTIDLVSPGLVLFNIERNIVFFSDAPQEPVFTHPGERREIFRFHLISLLPENQIPARLMNFSESTSTPSISNSTAFIIFNFVL